MNQPANKYTRYYCGIIEGQRIIQTEPFTKEQNAKYEYVGACPNKSVMEIVYTRYLQMQGVFKYWFLRSLPLIIYTAHEKDNHDVTIHNPLVA